MICCLLAAASVLGAGFLPVSRQTRLLGDTITTTESVSAQATSYSGDWNTYYSFGNTFIGSGDGTTWGGYSADSWGQHSESYSTVTVGPGATLGSKIITGEVKGYGYQNDGGYYDSAEVASVVAVDIHLDGPAIFSLSANFTNFTDANSGWSDSEGTITGDLGSADYSTFGNNASWNSYNNSGYLDPGDYKFVATATGDATSNYYGGPGDFFSDLTFNISLKPVPEPGALTIFGGGFLILSLVGWKRRWARADSKNDDASAMQSPDR
jgi:hypothetical protein